MMKRFAIILSVLLLAACKPDAYLGPLDSPVGNWEGYKGEFYFNGEKVAELDSCSIKAISFYKQGFCCIENVKGAFPYTYDHASGDLQIDSTRWNVPTLTGAEMVMKFIDRILPPEPVVPEKPVEPENPSEPAGPGETETPGEVETPEDDGPAVVPENPGETGDAENPDDPEDPEGGDDSEVPEEPVEPEEPEVKPDVNGVILPAEYKGFTINADKNGYYYVNASGKTVYCNFRGVKDASDILIIDFWYDTTTSYFRPLVREVKKK